MPSCASSFMTSRTSPTISGSSALVGSSKSMTSGSIMSARTMATRCFCPPDSCAGYAPPRSPRPTRCSSFSACASASACDLCRSFTGARVMLRRMVICGKRLKCWNTMPIFCRWRLMLQLLSVISTPLNRMRPPVGTSSRLRQRRNVDLPEPDGPMTTTTSPFLISAETPSSALMGDAPAKCFFRS